MKSYVVPVWENKTAPCGGLDGCPAYTDIAGALHALSLGDAHTAWKIMMESHPLRATLGRVCYAFCEKPCNRGYFDSPISIQMLEAVIGDHGFDKNWRPDIAPANGKKVLIIGAGPAGLSAGWFLNIHGYSVVIHEAQKEPGGVLRYGIPEYRLPKSVLSREIKLIEDCGVEILCDSKISNDQISNYLRSGEFDAVIVAGGAGASRKAGFTNESAAMDGLGFLKRVNTSDGNDKTFKDKTVIVVGGGNVAMDACRSAVRLNAKSVKVFYRRTEEMMPAHEHEVTQAKTEGVEFHFLLTPERFTQGVLTAQEMTLGTVDNSGRSRPHPSGRFVEFPADFVIMAIGQTMENWPDPGELKNLYIAGDANPKSQGTVIHAIADGKKAANDVNMALINKPLFPSLREEVTYDKMNVKRYFEPRMRLRSAEEKPNTRKTSFAPVDVIVSLNEGIIEAQRCFRCGICIGGLNTDCDWCFRACGDENSINKFMEPWSVTGPFYEMKDECDSCGRCWEDCPRYVVTAREVTGKSNE